MQGKLMTSTDKRKVLVVGMGATGLSCVRYLHALGDEVTIIDSRDVPPGLKALREEYTDVEIITGTLESPLYESADLLVVSPGVSIRTPVIAKAIERGVEVAGDVELFARAINETGANVIAITGSNGKSTVTSLVGKICKAAGKNTLVGGNIGKPVLELLDEPVADVYVLELSSFQLETTQSLSTLSAVVLNISEDHMDRYSSLEDYAGSKATIYNNCKHTLINRDDDVASSLVSGGDNVVSFGMSVPKTDKEYGIDADGLFIVCGTEKLLALSDIRMLGQHNIGNVMAAMALVAPLTIPLDVISGVTKQFSGLAHRSQVVAEASGVSWVNDSKATNVGATIAALQGINRPVILIAGGEGKDADFDPLGKVITQYVKHLILIGRDAKLIEASAKGVECTHAASMEQAVAIASKAASSGDAVLLSPACASFDMYNSFEHRGNVFSEAVRNQVIEGAGQ
ncbi:MAG: UDP-N-acetylmuramoyl-L-alanine--D-glutamate ligase [Proteobacteria bacterium]|nr:UDP-N-acetylmuramoyl-L-alanine--D-glutamate ligase [Pseudomonadota bacterium]